MTFCTKLYSFFLLLFLTSAYSYSQINESIRDASNNHQSGNDNNNSGNNSGSTTSNDDDYDYSSSGSSGSGCADLSGCGALMCPAVLSIFPSTIQYHKNLLEKKYFVPRTTSIDVMLHGGYNPAENYWMTIPRIRANWGLFSTDFRIFSNIEFRQNAVDTWRTYDWQFLQFNFVHTKQVTVKIGQGISWEQFSGSAFHESSLGVDLCFLDEKLFFRNEGRIVLDWGPVNDPVVRTELSATGNYKLMDSKHLAIFGTLGGIYQRYYQAVSIWTIQTGVHFSIR